MGSENTLLNRALLNSLASKHQLTLLGVVSLGLEEDYERYLNWLQDGHHAGMHFLEKNGHCRKDPRQLLPGSKTALIFGYPYFQGDRLVSGAQTRVAQYARMRDYHKTLRKSCLDFWADLQVAVGLRAEMRVTVDSAPVLERALAKRTQEGFIGKNTLFIHPQHGSYLLLSEILTDLVIEPDVPANIDPEKRTPSGGCGSCKRCQVHCPTGALDRDYRIDARKCLAYYTIEHRDTIPLQYWPALRLYFFGCDICQLACPYNRDLKAVKTLELRVNQLPPLDEIALMTQEKYELWFGGSPMTRAKISGLKRNALIALVVTDSPKLSLVIKAIIAEKLPPSNLLARTLAQIVQYGPRYSQLLRNF